MKITCFICCLALYLSQPASGIFFNSNWLQNLLNPTTTTTPSPAAGGPSLSFFNISPQVFVNNEVTGTTAYSNLILAIGQNISGLSRRKRSLFDNVAKSVDNGFSKVRKGFGAFTNPLKTRLSSLIGGSTSGSVSGNTTTSGSIGASGPISNSSSINSTNQSYQPHNNNGSKVSSNSSASLADQQPPQDQLQSPGTEESKPLQNPPSTQSEQSPAQSQQPQTAPNTNSSQTDDIHNRASNFLSGLQDRLANSSITNFFPSNISQSLMEFMKNPIASMSDRLNKTNFQQNFTNDVTNFVDQLASNNPGIQNFIANNSVNTSNPFQTFAQLGMNGLIPNPVETLANLSMDQLENKVKDQINNGLSDVQKTVQEAQFFSSKMTDSIPNLAGNAIKDIQNMIHLSGVIACVNKHPLPFSNVIQIAANSSSKCVAEKVNQATGILTSTADSLRNATTDLQKLRDSISKCSQKISSGSSGFSLSNTIALNTCYAAALFNIQCDTILLPITIGQRIADGFDLANSLKGHMTKCVANLAQDIATQAFTASQAIAKCIVDSTG